MATHFNMNRRNFIVQTVVGSAALTGVLTFASCKTIEVLSLEPSNKRLDVPVSKFATANFLRVRSSVLQYDVLVVKSANNTYSAYYMKCTHNDASVQFDGRNFQCPLHGSSFDGNGKVLTGPATNNLRTFEVTQNENLISIFIS